MIYHILFLVAAVLVNSSRADKVQDFNASDVNEYKLSSNESIYLYYNQSSCFYGIWNPKKQLAILYASKDNLLGVYNTSSASLLIVSTNNNHVTLKVHTRIEFSSTNLQNAFSKMYIFMTKRRKSIASNGTFTIDISFHELLRISTENQCQVNCDFLRSLRNTFGEYIAAVSASISNNFRGFGSLFTPLLATARNVSTAFSGFFDAVIQRGTGLPRNLIDAFGLAIGRGVQFLNTGLIGQLSSAIRATGAFFNNITEALRQVFVGSGILNFNSTVISDRNKNISVNTLITGDNSWIVHVGNNSANMTINYNSNSNLFGFYNRHLNISVVFNGNTGIYALFNVTSGVGLIISQLSGNAKITVDSSGKIHNAFNEKRNVTSGFILIGQSIERNSDGLNDLINLNPNVFSFRLVVILLRSGLNINIAFLGKGDALQTVRTNFETLFNEASKYFQQSNSGFDLSLGPLNILFPVLYFRQFTNNFIPIIRNIFANLGGSFNPELMLNMAITFSRNIGSGVNRFIFGALNFALNSARNFTGGINNIIQGILGELPSGEINFNVKFGQKRYNCQNSTK